MNDLIEKMDKSIESLKSNFSTVRTGRASPDLLAKVKVDCYGSLVPLKQMASVHVQDGNVLVVQPFDRTAMSAIEKGIQKSELGLNPSNDGHTLRIAFPPLTEERRKELDKIVKKMAEEARVAIRNIRRDFIDKIKKEKDGTEDEIKRKEQEIQKTTDRFMNTIEEHVKYKEKEIMEI